MDQEAETHHGEDHQTQGQLQNDHPVAEQRLLRDAPAIDEQQRRQEQQEEDVRPQVHRLAGDHHHARAQGDLHQRQGDPRNPRHPP
ncbi:hypothetical protein D3C80_1278590 [compost metagenome]